MARPLPWLPPEVRRHAVNALIAANAAHPIVDGTYGRTHPDNAEKVLDAMLLELDPWIN